jgi:hypothetical protein
VLLSAAVVRHERFPTFIVTFDGAKCHAPIDPCRVSWLMKSSNRTPPDLMQVPGPIAALNVSGSHASISNTACCLGLSGLG